MAHGYAAFGFAARSESHRIAGRIEGPIQVVSFLQPSSSPSIEQRLRTAPRSEFT
jgi:hypothetical protein